MSEKLTIDQLREAKIRMEGEHAIKRKILMKIEPVMDIEDELTKAKAQVADLQKYRDTMRKSIETCIKELEAALEAKLF